MKKELKIARQLIVDTKSLYSSHLLGIYTTMIQNFNCDLRYSAQAIRETIEDEYFGGIEPNWASLEACEWWENFNAKYFIEGIHRGAFNSKSITFEWSENNKPPTKLFTNED
tara:strand:+ start:727 stop:1062 length:336 start_codon:yes stop_codon:yes gene_type:complete